MRDDSKKSIDELLKETARQKNAALPFASWKETLFKTIEEQEANRLSSAPADEKDQNIRPLETRKQRAARMRRRWTVGISTAAAALLIVLGIHALSRNDFETPQEYMQKAESGLPAPLLGDDNNEADTGPSIYSVEPRSIEPGAAAENDGAASDNICEGGNPPSSDGSTSDRTGAGEARLPKDGPQPTQSGLGSDAGDRAMLTDQEQAAVDAVRAAVAAATGEPIESDEFAYVAYGGKRSSYTIEPFASPTGSTNAQADKDAEIYIVILDSRDENPPQYAVDMETGAALGIIIYP